MEASDGPQSTIELAFGETCFGGLWRGRMYATKQVETIAVQERGDWLVITVLAKYF